MFVENLRKKKNLVLVLSVLFMLISSYGVFGATWYRDYDGDTYGDPIVSIEADTQPPGYVPNNLDCDDQDPVEKPNQVWRRERDGDGYCHATISGTGCEKINNHIVATSCPATNDCNDDSAEQFPGQVWYRDADADGYCDSNKVEGNGKRTQCLDPGPNFIVASTCDATDDCDDGSGTINPDSPENTAELCSDYDADDNPIDNDCDGYANCDEPDCTAVTLIEICDDGLDNDCDLKIDCSDGSCCRECDDLPGSETACPTMQFCWDISIDDTYDPDTFKNPITCTSPVSKIDGKYVFLSSDTVFAVLKIPETFVETLKQNDVINLDIINTADGSVNGDTSLSFMIPYDLEDVYNADMYLYEEIILADEFFDVSSGTTEFSLQFSLAGDNVGDEPFFVSSESACTNARPGAVCCSAGGYTCVNPMNKDGKTYGEVKQDLGEEPDFEKEFEGPCGGAGVCCYSVDDCLDLSKTDGRVYRDIVLPDECESEGFLGCEDLIYAYRYYFFHDDGTAHEHKLPFGDVSEIDFRLSIDDETNKIQCFDKSDINIKWYHYKHQNNNPGTIANGFWIESPDPTVEFSNNVKNFNIKSKIDYLGFVGLFKSEECVETDCDYGGTKLESNLVWTDDEEDHSKEIVFNLCGVLQGCNVEKDGLCNEACAGFGLGDPDCVKDCASPEECCANTDDQCCLISNDFVLDSDDCGEGVDIGCDKLEDFCCSGVTETCDENCGPLAEDCPGTCASSNDGCCGPFKAEESMVGSGLFWFYILGSTTFYFADGVCDPDCGIVNYLPDYACNPASDTVCDSNCISGKDPDCGSCTANGGDCCVPDSDPVDPDCTAFVDPDCAAEKNIVCTGDIGDCCLPECDGLCDYDCVFGIDGDCNVGSACVAYSDPEEDEPGSGDGDGDIDDGEGSTNSGPGLDTDDSSDDDGTSGDGMDHSGTEGDDSY